MFATFMIVLREILEAGLIIGIVLTATRGIEKRTQWVFAGILGGILGAIAIAFFADTLSNAAEGMGQEIVNASILGVAVCMLLWHNAWMAHHGKELAKEMKQIGQAVRIGSKSLLALSVVVGAAVMREGAEIVLFLYGIFHSGSSLFQMQMGGLLGLVVGGLISFATYKGLLIIPMRHIFKVTSWMIALLAAGMATQAVGLLQQAQILPYLEQTLWNSEFILSESSLLGHSLHILIGYTQEPTALQVIAYIAILAVNFGMIAGINRRVAKKTSFSKG